MSTVTINAVRKGFYLDSVALMRMSRSLADLDGVEEAAMMMGTPANHQIMEDAGLLDEVGKDAGGGDLVIGIVESVRNNLWFAEINGPFNGLLPMSLAPWKVEFGAAREQMDVGDVMLARVQEVDESHSVVLTMKGVGLRRLNEGMMSEISMNHIAIVRGENDENLRALKEASDCRIIVAENGRVWVDGDSDGVSWMRGVLEMVREKGHMANFNSLLQDMMKDAPSGGVA